MNPLLPCNAASAELLWECFMKKKSFFGILATVVLATDFLFSACSGGTNYVGENDNQNSEEKKSYTVTVSEIITNGTITPSKTTALEGDSINLIVTPSNGYALDSLSVKDADENNVIVIAGAFLMPASNVTISAVFKVATVSYSVTIDSSITNGNVLSDKTSSVASGDTVTLTVTADGTRRLKSLAVTDSNNNVVPTTNVTAGTTYTFVMPSSDVTIMAIFGYLGSKVTPNAVGDIVFSDGTAEAYDISLTMTTEQNDNVVGVFASSSGNYIVGIKQGGGNYFSYADASTTKLSEHSVATPAPYNSNWRITASAELNEIRNNITDINNSLEKITGAVQIYTSGTGYLISDHEGYLFDFSDAQEVADSSPGRVLFVHDVIVN